MIVLVCTGGLEEADVLLTGLDVTLDVLCCCTMVVATGVLSPVRRPDVVFETSGIRRHRESLLWKDGYG